VLHAGHAVTDVQRAGFVTMAAVRKEFDSGVVAVDDVSLDVQPGEFVSVVGPSGCGKSTLLRLVAGLTPVSGGTIQVNGSQVEGPRQDIGLMFQRPTLLPWKTALENAVLPVRLRGSAGAADRDRVMELLQLLGLAGFEYTYPRHLSGGMQQRVALARLLIQGVGVLLLDEPFAAVDELTRERLNLELLAIYQRSRATVVLVTHNINEATLLADRVVVMTPRPGRVSDVLPVPFERPRTLEITKSPEFQDLVFRARERLHANEGAGSPGR
jgi:NitT/TauT family transport system ATP-binding protein